ncbi:MAG: primosomal protein N' [Ignavibacteriae bacterium]|nr:primosomal protein N' [Ignavibacteria bacterium]MBI3365745.1 primosomal protein N' [Ignavibacteriota bacterium]
MSDLYVDLAIPGAVDKLFTYIVPHELEHAIKRGVRVVTSFGKRTVIGFVVDTSATSQECAEHGRNVPHIKPIQDVLDVEPVISDELLNLTKWISEYYFAPWGEVLKTVLVQGAARPGKRTIKLTVKDLMSALHELAHAPKQATVLRELSERSPISIQQLQKIIRTKSIYATLNELVSRKMVEIHEEMPRSKLKPKLEQVIEIDDRAKTCWRAWLSQPQALSKRLVRQAAILNQLLETGESYIGITEILKRSGESLSAVKTLAEKKLITLSKREILRTTEFDLYESALGAQNVTLNAHQQAALSEIGAAISNRAFHTFLLHGVTGSGKTQVYIEAIREARRQQKTAIVLVPEISLTPQIVRRFKLHFGNQVAVIHSRMSIGERYDTWRTVWEGRCSIVIGPRSAIFAPLKNLGLIVVDEEQESSYKQFDQTPRYHARDVAIIRASYTHAVVVLGSATPSLESFANAMNGKYTLLEMSERVDNAQLPQITIVDMTRERRRMLEDFLKSRSVKTDNVPVNPQREKRTIEWSSLSDLLKKKIEDRLTKKEGIILLQNRRGFSPFIECPDCGYVETCDNCNISLTYHLTKKHLRCHYCGLVKQLIAVCPKCQSHEMRYRGFGTQRVEEELKKIFPSASMIRMDLDTTSRRGAHDAILRKFSDGEVDILLGTQMVAKGLDFSRVTLVGVISADTQMLLPDFRSAERTFQLLTQVAGRAGRSSLAGEVIIQTYQPKHPSLQHVVLHDYPGFYSEEVEFRRELEYPPFSRLLLIEFKGKQEQEVMAHASKFAEFLQKQNAAFHVLGPAGAALTRLKGLFRWHIIVKSLKDKDPGGYIVHRGIHSAVHAYKTSALGKSRSVKMVVDVDPVGMM